MSYGAEMQSVQEPMIEYARNAGWQYLSPDEAKKMRGGSTGLVLEEVLVRQLLRLNDFLDDAGAREFTARLRRNAGGVEGNLEAWRKMCGLTTSYIESEGREKKVRVFDDWDALANDFHVTKELSFGREQNPPRLDVAFFINGVPVALSETKAATLSGGTGKALKQVRGYHEEGPELFALLQLFNLANIAEFTYGATWNTSPKALFDWRDAEAGNFEGCVKTFFDPERVLAMVRDSVLFVRREGELQKVVLRPHQMRAVERVRGRVLDPEKKRGLVWHSQGSGKTYTMIVAAKKLLDDESLQNPTVLMLIDRTELETQLEDNLRAVGIEGVRRAGNKAELVRMLREGQPGLIVSMIHKFDDVPADITGRENFVVLVDEAHRTTGGNLGNRLTGALPGATLIGFTGTPIDRTAHGEGTFKTFGRDDEEGYLDRYTIRQSIEDRTTVPLHYSLAPGNLLVDRETLEREFLDLKELEGVSEVEEINTVLERAVTLRNLLKNPNRVAGIASYIARHFKEKVEPAGYKAFVVAPDREGCTLYKKALDEHLPPEWSEVVISAGMGDSEELRAFHLAEGEEKRIRRDFRKAEKQPKILIVTEKLLTGYDAPLLYAMYLDKPMRDHALLQAIARVNRPYEDGAGRRKPSGFILDFVGIFDNLQKALAFDSEEVSGVVAGIDVLQTRFEKLMERGRRDYLTIIGEHQNDKAVEAVLEHFRDAKRREEFYTFFRDLEELYEILSPDAFLSPYLDDYEKLAAIRATLKTRYGRSKTVEADEDFLAKTAQLVRESTTAPVLKEPEGEWELTPEALVAIAGGDGGEATKISNLLIGVRKLVGVKSGKNPHLISIGERAEKIASDYDARLKDSGETLESLLDVLQSLEAADARRAESGLSVEAFAVREMLEVRGVERATEAAGTLAETLDAYPLWKSKEDEEREVRMAFHAALNGAGERDVGSREEIIHEVLGGLKAGGE